MNIRWSPIKVNPRNVVMQQCARVLEDRSVEHYLKPRVTTNTSYGGSRSVNGGTDAMLVSTVDIRIPNTKFVCRMHVH